MMTMMMMMGLVSQYRKWYRTVEELNRRIVMTMMNLIMIMMILP